MAIRLKKNDTVIVLAGKDRGKTGKILKLLPATDQAVVEGLNLRRRRIRPRRSGEKGQTVDKVQPIHLSNLALYCDRCQRGVRLRSRLDGGRKTRLCVKCNRAI